MTEPALSFRGVEKRYRRVRSMQRGGVRLLNRAIGRGNVLALRDADIDIAKGETFGLIGVNGSGKSTFLRLAAGVTAPSAGTVFRASPKVGAILSLGDGFHPLLTGRENAMTGAVLAGLSRREAQARMPAMLEFCELGDALDDPLRTYSSGMFVRLAFAVAVHVDADLLLVDEAMAVGDLTFAEKCLRRMEDLKAQGVTIVVASHDLGVLSRLCDRAAWISDGRIELVGEPEYVIDRYNKAMHERTNALTPAERTEAGKIGTGEVEITDVSVVTRDNLDVEALPAGWPLEVTIDLLPKVDAERAVLGLSLHREDGVQCLDLSTTVTLSAGRPLSAGLKVERLDLTEGRYHLDVGVYAPDWDHAFDYRWQSNWIKVIGSSSPGVLAPPHQWVIE